MVRHGVWGVLAQELYTPRGVSPSHLSPQMYYFQTDEASGDEGIGPGSQLERGRARIPTHVCVA